VAAGASSRYAAATAAADTRGFGGAVTGCAAASSVPAGAGAFAVRGALFLADPDGLDDPEVRADADRGAVLRGARGVAGAGRAELGFSAASAAEIPGSGGAAEEESVMSKGSSCDGGREAVTRPT